MTNLLSRLGVTPASPEEAGAWRTAWNASYVQARRAAAAAAVQQAATNITAAVKRLREGGLIAPSTSVQDLVHCVSGHLQPRLFPDTPLVSLALQYFRRRNAVPTYLELLHACQRHLPIELVVNVDSPHEARLWANVSAATGGAVVPVLSYNVHELRSYNRMTGMARGKYVVLLQDDDKLTPEDCSWLPQLVAQFESMPGLAMVGMNSFQLSHGEGNNREFNYWRDPKTGNKMMFAFQVDLAPIAFRRSALRAVGGFDEGMSDPGECGIWSDWELTIRMWVAGWQAAFMPLVGKSRATPNETSGTHKPETGVRCWGRQQNVASACYMGRWGAGFGASGPGKFLEKLENYVRQTNLRLLQGSYPPDACPFRKGCGLEGDPPLPDKYNYSYAALPVAMVLA
ncbi:hypothetical protein HYH02_001837 [Chlamydomonas schloesseri]|uniref:Glycosyltransferase 2-like domain-containing protein n=1 Tax=Chlamydomonas schloesseri TaxID=2026947 RepID=A0A836BBJ0_9CHLO|nr:hypothetical protein HYH02_001837 [Chlamydomonas schloesseri]|eukprot:KAG2453622.1 hypothetical protein HYH02_001837 [Chlamydomonas schloesseri]